MQCYGIIVNELIKIVKFHCIYEFYNHIDYNATEKLVLDENGKSIFSVFHENVFFFFF